MAEQECNIGWPEWKTVRLIGRGSFGSVFELEKNIFGDVEKAALKVISIPQNDGDIDEMLGDGYDSESLTETFQSHLKSIIAEYSLMRKMSSCANVVMCDDVRYVQHDDGIGWDIFIKMELLNPILKQLPINAPEDAVIRLGEDICSALEICAHHNVIHRDIKPQNIFVSDDGVYKLGDFGIAKTVEKTMGGTKVGTYKFMAPEVYYSKPYGAAADQYSLGLVLYWLLNERRMPFMEMPPAKITADKESRSRQRRFSGEELPPPAHGSEALKAIVLKACAFDPKKRFASAAEMRKALKQLREPTHWTEPMPVVIPVAPPVLQSASALQADICIQFQDGKGNEIQTGFYCPGDPVDSPDMEAAIECDEQRYRFLCWSPPAPLVAEKSMVCTAVYGKDAAAVEVEQTSAQKTAHTRKTKSKKPLLAACVALCLIGGAAAFLMPEKQNSEFPGDLQSGSSSVTKPIVNSGETANIEGTIPSQKGESTNQNKIKLIVGSGVGVIPDLVARTLADSEKRVSANTTITVENVVGGDGFAAATMFCENDPAGQEALVCQYETFYRHDLGKIYGTEIVEFNRNDMTPVCVLAEREMILYTKSGTTLKDIIEKAKNGRIKLAVGQPLSTPHLMLGTLCDLLGGNVVVKSYDGVKNQQQSLVDGEVDVFVGFADEAKDKVYAGEIVPVLSFSEEAYNGYSGYSVPSVAGNGKAVELPSNIDFSICIIPNGYVLMVRTDTSAKLFNDLTNVIKDNTTYAEWLDSLTLKQVELYGPDVTARINTACERVVDAFGRVMNK